MNCSDIIKDCAVNEQFSENDKLEILELAEEFLEEDQLALTRRIAYLAFVRKNLATEMKNGSYLRLC